MPSHIVSSSFFLCLSLLLAACQGYDIKVNDRVVYSPPPLFTGFDIADPALRACVEQAIVDQSVTAPAELVDLNCAHAGITDLGGLSVFTGLRRLRMSANGIRNLVELNRLDELRELYLDDNRIVDPVPLYGLSALDHLDLSGNPDLQCPRDAALAGVKTLQLPNHCPAPGA
ncbi:MAG: hypothetical protein CME59_14695 [Halioglobus sp.]|nr:hypothetical protein [Halioglobus sp.]